MKHKFHDCTGGHTRPGWMSRTYQAWVSMRWRCEKGSRNHGARGITVCARWRRFPNFLADMGECPEDLQLDRINNDGNYEPGNCRWATAREQALNRRPRTTEHLRNNTAAMRAVNAKLTPETVRYIRRVYIGHRKPPFLRDLAAELGVDHTLIHQVVQGKIWKDIA